MKKIQLLTSTAMLLATPFDNTGGTWKKDENGNLVAGDDGNPIYIDTNNKEQSLDVGTISRLNGEAKTHREQKEAAEKALAVFDGIDPVAAKKAIADLKDVDLTKLVGLDKVEEIKQTLTTQFGDQLKEKDTALEVAYSTIDQMTIDQAFGNSAFLEDNVILPDYVQMKFADKFKVIDGKAVPHGPNGEPLPSPKNFGETATFEEAIEVFVNGDASKDKYLKPDDQRGTGNQGDGGDRGDKGSKTMKRSAFDALPPAEQGKVGLDPEMQIVD